VSDKRKKHLANAKARKANLTKAEHQAEQAKAAAPAKAKKPIARAIQKIKALLAKVADRIKRIRSRGHDKPKGQVTQYDSVNPSGIPASASYVAAYVNGLYANVAAMRARFPKAHIETIAVTSSADADWLDVETGDATPGQCADWYHRQKSKGAKRPGFYANLSTMAQVITALRAAGIKRGQVRLWTADPDGKPHINKAGDYPNLDWSADGTQYQWTSGYDASLCKPSFFA
jgi:hypothetical protein